MSELKKTATEILQEKMERFNKVVPKIYYPEVPQYNYNIDEVVSKFEIDSENTFEYQAQQLINQIIDKSDEQIALLTKQYEQLSNNYQKLEELYKIKEQELEGSKEEAKKSKRYNLVMFILTIISMLIAIASWLLPNVLGGAS